MKAQKGEIITGLRVRKALQSLIDSRHPCTIKIPDTPFCWDGLIARIHNQDNSQSLFIGGVGGFEDALPPFQE